MSFAEVVWQRTSHSSSLDSTNHESSAILIRTALWFPKVRIPCCACVSTDYSKTSLPDSNQATAHESIPACGVLVSAGRHLVDPMKELVTCNLHMMSCCCICLVMFKDCKQMCSAQLYDVPAFLTTRTFWGFYTSSTTSAVL
eukprot:3427546-Amphidinium_carterae.1